MTDNIILKTIKEVEFFNTRVSLEIFTNERRTYLILSEQKIFDIDSLKKYLIENDLNQFAKNEITNLISLIDYFFKLNIKHSEIPYGENFYHYINENKFGRVESSGFSKWFYVLYENDKFANPNESRFKVKHQSDLIFISLHSSRISNKLIEIKDLFSDFIETPQQSEAIVSVEVKKELHNNIFKGNSFEIWQHLFDDFKIKKSSRTDIDFMFQIMKYDSLIYDNIGLIDIQKWINKTYQISVDKVKYTNPKSKSNEKRMSTYNLINPK
tara:strand:- start:638 stop:1444 length:807 start_codon:yes stop_codon:yes gene_type:complete